MLDPLMGELMVASDWRNKDGVWVSVRGAGGWVGVRVAGDVSTFVDSRTLMVTADWRNKDAMEELTTAQLDSQKSSTGTVSSAAMTLSLRAAASLPAPPLGPPRGRRTASVVRATASPPPALHNRNRPRPQNVSCEFFFVDCATCRWMAPEVFNRIDGMSAVAAQPSSDETRTKALQEKIIITTCHFQPPIKMPSSANQSIQSVIYLRLFSQCSTGVC